MALAGRRVEGFQWRPVSVRRKRSPRIAEFKPKANEAIEESHCSYMVFAESRDAYGENGEPRSIANLVIS